MSRPIFLCVPGGSCTPEFYDPLRKILTARGFSSEAIDLPSVDAKPSKYDFIEDAQAIRDATTKLADAGNEIVLVLHSYAGIPGSEALEGLGKSEREKKGLNGGVVRIVYVTSWVLPENSQLVERGDVSKFMPYQMIDLEVGTLTPNAEMAHEAFFEDLPKDQQIYWASKLKPISLGVFWSKTSYAAWRHIPSTVVLCEKDVTMGFQYSEYVANGAKANEPNLIGEVVVNKTAGHFVMLSQPEWLADVLSEAARF